MQTVAIISQKGGAGKTTLAIQLAAAAQAAGLVALIVDCDPQGSASRWGQWRMGREPEVVPCPTSQMLGPTLAGAAELGADLVVIDTPPHADALSAAACQIANHILVPCRPRAFDLDAVRTTAELLKAHNQQGFVIFSSGPQRAIHIYAEAAEILLSFGLNIAPVALSERAAYCHAIAAGLSVQEYEPEGRAAAEVAALWTWLCQRVNTSTNKHANIRGQG